jgi:hypothetical protein
MSGYAPSPVSHLDADSAGTMPHEVPEYRLPPMAIVLSVAGLIPFIICSLFAARSSVEGGNEGLLALISYGAVILSFIGAVHWGFVLEGEKQPIERGRLSLAVVPALIGWSAALLAIWHHAPLGLVLLIAGYIAAVVVEGRGRRYDLVPRSYLFMRWGLTIIVVALMTTVLVLRLLGSNMLD